MTADMAKLDKATLGASTALAGLMQAVDSTAKHYAEFNASVAMASAQADVRQTMRDIDRGRLIGSNLGNYVTAKSKLENDVEDIKAQLLNVLLPYITGLVDKINEGVRLAGILGNAAEIATRFERGVFGQVTGIADILDYFKSKAQADDMKDPITVLFENETGLVMPPEGGGR